MSGNSTASGCILTIESRSTTGFVFSCRFSQSNGGAEQTLANGDQFDYIAIPTN